MKSATKPIESEQPAKDILLEARCLAANSLRFLDDAQRCFATPDLVQGFLVQASEYAEKTVEAIKDLRKMLPHSSRLG
jgi:hypothetical protein